MTKKKGVPKRIDFICKTTNKRGMFVCERAPKIKKRKKRR